MTILSKNCTLTLFSPVGGGVGSVLSGGSFADGAYSAAFFHLFNNEVERYGALKAARMKAYQNRLKANGVLDLEVAEVWLEIDQMIDRLVAMKSSNGGVLTSEHVSAGSDTAFAFGPQDREVGQVGFAVRIHSGGVLVAEVNSWNSTTLE